MVAGKRLLLVSPVKKAQVAITTKSLGFVHAHNLWRKPAARMKILGNWLVAYVSSESPA